MHEIKQGTLTTKTVKSSFEETVERFVASDSTFSFMNSIKGMPVYWKRFG